MDDIYEDNTPLENCVFPKRGTANYSDLRNPRWIGACCDMTTIVLNSRILKYQILKIKKIKRQLK